MDDMIKKDLQKQIECYLTHLTDASYYGTGTSFSKEPKIDLQETYNRVTSSKFRKTKITEETEKDIKFKIENCAQKRSPLQLRVPFGAYKAWRLGLDFQPDWAEVFNISYHLKYAANILDVYPFGVEITYTFSDDLMYFVSDIPRDKARNYTIVFQKLLDIFNLVSEKIHFKLVEINSLYDSAESYYIDFLKCFLDNLIYWDTKYGEETKSRHLNSAHNNLFLYGERKIGELDKSTQEKYFYYSALMTDAVDCLKERRKFNKDQDKIQLVGVKGPSKCINMGACETSTVHFWTGRGVIKFNKGKLKPYIFTHTNMQKFEDKNKTISLEVNTVFCKVSKNYQNILFIQED